MSHYSQHSWITFIKITANVQQQINSTRGKERKENNSNLNKYPNMIIIRYDMNPIRTVSSSAQYNISSSALLTVVTITRQPWCAAHIQMIK